MFFYSFKGLVAIKKPIFGPIILPILTPYFSRFYHFNIDIIGLKYIVRIFSCKETHFYVKYLYKSNHKKVVVVTNVLC